MMVVAARQLLADIVTIDGSQTRETSTPMPRLLGPTNYSVGDAVPVHGYNLARDDIHTSEPAFVSGLFDIAPALEAAAVPRFGAAASAPAAAPAAPIDVNAFAAAVAKAATAAATTSATGAKTGNDDLLREAFTAQQLEARADREQRANADRAKNVAVQAGEKVDNEHYHQLVADPKAKRVVEQAHQHFNALARDSSGTLKSPEQVAKCWKVASFEITAGSGGLAFATTRPPSNPATIHTPPTMTSLASGPPSPGGASPATPATPPRAIQTIYKISEQLCNSNWITSLRSISQAE